ncbi:hypothetical protein C6497_10085 [Candidatus Poribacteria bacterium]|nr:MAG: hypothetical protein C6497_10085 [Candidatus Poribacteria bacterium]
MRAKKKSKSKKLTLKYLEVEEITILGSENIPDTAFRAAKQIILKITSKHPEIRKYLSGYECVLVSPEECVQSSVRWKKDHLKSLAGLAIRPRNDLGFPGRLAASIQWRKKPSMRVFIHEFGHAIGFVIAKLDPHYEILLKQSFRKAMDLGLWQNERFIKKIGKPGHDPVAEYWAEGVRWWYTWGKGQKFKSRDEFIQYDPGLTHLLDRWLSDEEIPLTY